MVSSALNCRIPTHRFLTPPPAPPSMSAKVILIESKRRFQPLLIPNNPLYRLQKRCSRKISCVNSSYSSSPPPRARFNPSTRLYVSGLSFRTTEESLTNAFKVFGELIEVNLVMDRIANRPRGFAFLRYTSEEESKKAIEGMHGKFLDGRVIFVEIAKPRAEVRQDFKQNPQVELNLCHARPPDLDSSIQDNVTTC